MIKPHEVTTYARSEVVLLALAMPDIVIYGQSAPGYFATKDLGRILNFPFLM